jgi:GntR family transcriptional regulator
MTLKKNSAIPLYYQLKMWLVDQIDSGELIPGDQIPTEQELCEQFDLSRGTVRRALGELISEQRLYLVRGRGTFVAELPRPPWVLATAVSIAEALEKQGVPFETHVLAQRLQEADPLVATKLRIEPGEPVVFLERLRVVNGEPLVIFTSHLPEKLVPGLVNIDLTNRSLYRALEEGHGVRISFMDRVLCSRLADKREAEMLGVFTPAAVHVFENLGYDAKGQPIDFGYDVYRGDKSSFEFRVNRVE